jgi:hypothetical protein
MDLWNFPPERPDRDRTSVHGREAAAAQRVVDGQVLVLNLPGSPSAVREVIGEEEEARKRGGSDSVAGPGAPDSAPLSP